MKRAVILVLFGLLQAACTTTAPAADPTPVIDANPTAGAEPTAVSEPPVPTAIATESVEPAVGAEPTTVVEATGAPATIAAEPAATTVANGRNDDGTFYRGSPDAPVTLVEYSDFL